ncbi:50S ribosomal protein L15 [Candidatus Saccharibacteria bacterium]|jgi:large subunit ribosomal protein L15|nr:50S ribosomal protein L15 [Candidatus Saccharibacteria bacterium]
MTKYNELEAPANKDKVRVGRGISAGRGKTAGRGTKGQKARTGKKLRPMFQGGQRPLAQAVPKNRGFKTIKAPAQVVYADNLNSMKGLVDNASLYEAGMIATPFHKVKIIMRGELTAKLDVKVQAASKSVVEAIKKAGGTFEKVSTPLPMSAKQAESEDK